MKMRKIILILAVVILIFVVSCTKQTEETEEKFPEQETTVVPEEKEISSAEPAKEAEQLKTKIIAKGPKGTELVISPSMDKVIKGTVTITVNKVPPGTKFIDFHLESSERAEEESDGPPNLGSDDDGSNGWGLIIDTATYDNNKYRILALTFAEEPGPVVEPTEVVQTEVIINNPPTMYSRNYPTLLKGNWEPSTNEMTKILNSEVEELKALGVNTVSIVLEYNLNKNGSYYLEDEETYIAQLKKAKKAGFAVLVSPNFVGAAGHNWAKEGIAIDLKKHLQNSEEVALQWAQIAEQYQVEYFAPQNEFNGPIRGNFAEIGKEEARITTEWHKEMLPKLKNVFTGKLMAKLDEPREGIDVSGYDYVGITISHGNGDLPNVRKHIANQYVTLKEIGRNSNAKWLVSEAWFPYGGPWYSETKSADGKSLDELQDDYYKMSLEEYEKAGGKDYIFIAWLMPGMEIKGRPAEAVIRNYFKKI